MSVVSYPYNCLHATGLAPLPGRVKRRSWVIPVAMMLSGTLMIAMQPAQQRITDVTAIGMTTVVGGVLVLIILMALDGWFRPGECARCLGKDKASQSVQLGFWS